MDRKIIFLMLVLISLLLISCQPSVPKSEPKIDWPEFNKEYFENIGVNVTEYYNQKEGFSFLYREEWKLTEQNSIISLRKNIQEKEILIQITTEKTEFENIEDYINKVKPPLHRLGVSKRTEDAEMGGKAALFEYGHVTLGNEDKSTISVIGINKGNLYRLVYYSPIDFNRELNAFDTIVISFKYLE